mgnify:CR=1 FL=1
MSIPAKFIPLDNKNLPTFSATFFWFSLISFTTPFPPAARLPLKLSPCGILARVFSKGLPWIIRILKSPLGAVMEAIRENEKRVLACGYNVAQTKLLVFILSAAICGLAGSLRALHLSIVPIDSLHYLQSGQAVMMSILGGMGTFFGPFVGATVMLYLEDVVTSFTKHWMAVVGLIFMFFVLFFPKGIWGSILERLGSQKGASK